MQESDDYVRNLHARVVDVVLHVDFPAGEFQQTNERVSEDRIAQMADVRGFVGIDAGVFDQNLAFGDSQVFGCSSAASAAASRSRFTRALM